MDARTQVLADIAAIEDQVANFTRDMNVIAGNEPLDTNAYAAIKAELETAQTKLDAKKAELETIDAAGETAQSELSAALDAIQIGTETISLRALIGDEDSYQLVRIALLEREVQRAQDMVAIKASYESKIEAYENEVAELQELRQEVYRLSDKAADLEAKRDAAGAQIDEQQAEITRLKADNDNLRKRLEDSAKPKETTEDAKALLEKWKNSRPAITNVRWEDDRKKTHYLATLVSTGEEIRFGHLEKNQYREVSEAEAESFRAEQPIAESEASGETNPVPDNTLVGSVVEPPALQFPEAVPVNVQAASDTGGMVLSPEELTRKVYELEKRIDQIVGIDAVA